jgi:hypothetical protein
MPRPKAAIAIPHGALQPQSGWRLPQPEQVAERMTFPGVPNPAGTLSAWSMRRSVAHPPAIGTGGRRPRRSGSQAQETTSRPEAVTRNGS